MARSSSTEEPKLTLPIGHPQAAYVSPDLSGTDGTGTLPDDEQKAHDERNQAQEDEVAAAADHENKVATAEAKQAEAKQAEAPKAAPKAKAES